MALKEGLCLPGDNPVDVGCREVDHDLGLVIAHRIHELDALIELTLLVEALKQDEKHFDAVAFAKLLQRFLPQDVSLNNVESSHITTVVEKDASVRVLHRLEQFPASSFDVFQG